MSSQDCRALGTLYMSYLTDNMLCVRYTDPGPNVCSMMAGGSLVCRQGDTWWQHGFVSWGVIHANVCVNETLPEVHSSVVKYLPWIEQNTRGLFHRIYCALSQSAP